jgi:hypothetical protein
LIGYRIAHVLQMRTLLLFASLPFLSQAQHVGFGVKGGAVLTGTFTNHSGNARSDESKRHTLGPMVEVELLKGFGIEFDALFRKIGYTDTNNSDGPWLSRESDGSWEFPILLKYRVRRWASQPFVNSGYAFRSVKGSSAGFYEQLWSYRWGLCNDLQARRLTRA